MSYASANTNFTNSPTKLFVRGNGDKCTYDEMIKHIANYISINKDSEIEVTIGTDSQNHDKTKMVEVIAVHSVGHGGIYFYFAEYVRKITSLKEKIMEETSRSLMNANGFIDALSYELIEYDIDLDELKFNFSIHCDIGNYGKTNTLIKEIVSYVHSCGYDVKIKPDSYAASGIANKISK